MHVPRVNNYYVILTNTGSSLQSVDGVSLVDAGRVKVHTSQLEPEAVGYHNVL